MLPQNEISSLFFAFELIGYNRKKDLKCEDFITPSSFQILCVCVFVGNNISKDKLTPSLLEDDPEKALELQLNAFAEMQREENNKKAYRIYLSFPDGEIIYPGSQEVDIGPYLKDKNIDSLKAILSAFKDQPIHLYMDKASYEAIIVIRDTMIENPKFCIFCSDWENSIDLEESFYRAGYKVWRMSQREEKNKCKWHKI